MKYIILLIILVTNTSFLNAGLTASFRTKTDTVSDSLSYDSSRVTLQKAIEQLHHSEYVQSFNTFNKSAPLFLKTGDIRNAARCYANMGLIFMEIQEYEKAITNFQKADSLFLSMNAVEEQLFCKKDLALCYGNSGKPEKACDLLKTVIEKELPQIQNIKLKIACLFAYCDYLNDIEEEKKYIIEAYDLALETDDNQLIRAAILNLGWVNYKTGNLILAEKYVNQIYDSLHQDENESSLTSLEGNTYSLLSQLYAKKKIWEKAYHFQLQYEECQKLDNKTKAIKHIQHLEIRKEIEQQQLKFEQAQMEIKQKQERSIFVGIALTVLLIMSGIIIFLLYKREQAEKKLRKIERKEYTTKLVNEHHKVEAKSRELSTNTMLLMKKNEVLKKLKNQIEGYKETGQIEAPTEKEIKGKINEALSENSDWEAFKLQFNEIHPLFFNTLLKLHPGLSNNELRLCAYLKMHLNTKQIAQLISVQPQTVTIARYRMKKKMNLDKDVSLDEYIKQLDS